MKNNLTGHQPSKSALTDFVLLTVISIITALSAAYALRIPSDSLNITLLTLLFLFIYNRELPPLSASGKYWILLFSVILSSASIQGSLLRIKGETYTGLVKENYIGYFTARDAAALAIFAAGLYYSIRLLLPLLQKFNNHLQLKKPSEPLVHSERNAESPRKKEGILHGNRSFLMTMAALFLCWFPYFVAYYPGFILGDSCSSLRQALKMDDLSNHYPVMYTLFIRFCLSIGNVFGSLTFGCAIYTLLQMVFLSYALARSIQWLCGHGLPWQGGALLTVFFGLTPFFGQISIAMWKDPVFSASLLLWTLLLLDHVYPQRRKEENKKGIHPHSIDWTFLLKNSILLLLICLSRNNGIYLALFCALVFIITSLLCAKKKRRITGLKEAAAGTLSLVILCSVITGPVYTAAGVEPTEKVEQVGVMMNQMARTVALSGKMSDRDRAFMKKLLPLKKYRKAYRPCVVDLLKWDEDFDGDYLNKHPGEFYRTYFSMGIKNPRSYFQAWELLTFGYWAPNQWELFHDGGNLGKGGLGSIGMDEKLNRRIHPVYIGEKYKTGLRVYFDWNGTMPALGSVCWILLFALLIVVIRREWTLMMALMPSMALFLTLLLASPYYYWQRYGLAEYYLLPIYIYIILCGSSSPVRKAFRGKSSTTRRPEIPAGIHSDRPHPVIQNNPEPD